MFDLNLPQVVIGPVSFVILVFASWCVGEGGEILGKKYDASIIGGLVIAWLNTAPETIFFITALQSGNPRFAVGAVSGSSIVVCTIALGACLWIGTSARKTGSVMLQPAVKRQCYLLGSSVLVTVGIAATGFTTIAGFIGVGYYLWFIYYSLITKKESDDEVSKQQESRGDEEKGDIEEEEEEVPVSKGIGYLVVGGVLIVLCSGPFINCVVSFASYLQVNPILLAFFLAPIASEAPEILESISLSRKGNQQNINIAYSNLIGGTITKTTLLSGIFCFFGVAKGFVWESPSYSLSLILLSVCAAAASGIGALFHSQNKYHGMALFLLFAITGIIQYVTNAHFNTEVFPDEGFAHDDAHNTITGIANNM